MELIEQWKNQDSQDVYEIKHWGKGYFGINEKGHVTVHPNKNPEQAIDLKLLIDQLQDRGIQLPILLRFTDILRHQFGYNGVVLTDALYMLGIAKKWSLPQAVVLSIEAGNDMILGVRDSSQLSASVAALKQAITDGGLSMARINESVARIIALKIQYHLWPSTPEI